MGANQQVLLGGKSGLRPVNFSSYVEALSQSSTWTGIAYNKTAGCYCIVSIDKSVYGNPGSWTNNPNFSLPWVYTGVAANMVGNFTAATYVNGAGSAYWGGMGSWTAIATPAGTYGWSGISNDGTNVILTADGSEKSATGAGQSFSPGTSNQLVAGNHWKTAIGYNTPSNILIASTGNSTSGMISYDSAQTWGGMTLPFVNCYIGGDGSGNVGHSPRFCAVGLASNLCAVSDNGVSWTTGTLPATKNWGQVVWCANCWLALVAGETYCATSVDGLNWTARTLAAAYPGPSLHIPGTNGQLTQCLIPSGSNVIVVNTA